MVRCAGRPDDVEPANHWPLAWPVSPLSAPVQSPVYPLSCRVDRTAVCGQRRAVLRDSCRDWPALRRSLRARSAIESNPMEPPPVRGRAPAGLRHPVARPLPTSPTIVTTGP